MYQLLECYSSRQRGSKSSVLADCSKDTSNIENAVDDTLGRLAAHNPIDSANEKGVMVEASRELKSSWRSLEKKVTRKLESKQCRKVASDDEDRSTAKRCKR